VTDGLELHVPFAQQPLHDVPPQLHAPPLHDCPAAHGPHSLPAEPQLLAFWFATSTHVSPLQQPPVHDVFVHEHLPAILSQSRLAPHPEHLAPAAPQLAAFWLA
jgi:hypothetical protein